VINIMSPNYRAARVGKILLAFLLAFAALNFWGAWREYRVTSQLIDRGAAAPGVQTDTKFSTSNRQGQSSSSSYGIWRYIVAGKAYRLIDQGSLYTKGTIDVPRLGPPKPGQIIHLPDDPAVARLRSQLAPDLFGLLGGGIALLLASIALVYVLRRYTAFR
jgi:hypothetical protein